MGFPVLIKLEGLFIPSRYELGRVVTVATDGHDYYMVYDALDLKELVRIAHNVAHMPQRLEPIEADVALPLGVFEFLAGRRHKRVKIPLREVPAGLVTCENLRDVVIMHAEPWLLASPAGMEIAAVRAVEKMPICDVLGKIRVGREEAYYCRQGGRHLVKPLGRPWFELPQELLHLLKSAELQIERECNAEGLRQALGPEVEPEELARFAAQSLGISGEFLGRAFAVEREYGARERPHCHVERRHAYKVEVGGKARYGKFEVLCVDGYYERYCYAWRVGGLGPDAPAELIAECIDAEECPPELADGLPEPARERAYGELVRMLRWYMRGGWGPGVVRKFPLEVVKRVLGVGTYEEAEEEWRRVLEEEERRQEEELEAARRHLEEAKRELAERVAKAVEGLPVKVSVGRYVYVRPARPLGPEEFRQADFLLRALGFRYRPRWRAWVSAPEP